jgi:hypothetical protein
MARLWRAARLVMVAAIALGAGALPAVAQDIGQEALSYLGTYAFADSQHTWDQIKEFNAETVLDHDRDGFRPAGIMLPSGHMFYPSIAASTTFDDNLFLQPNGSKVADWRTSIAPAFEFQSNLPRNMFQIHGDAESVSFRNNSNLDYVNANIKADWRFDIDAADTFGGTFQSRLGHDDNFLPIDPANAAKAIPIFSNRAAFGYAHDAGRTAVATGVDIERNTYTDVPSYGGGMLDEAANDNTIAGGFAYASYKWSPGYRAFAAARVDREMFLNDRAAYGNNNSYRAEAGLIYELDPLLQFTVYAGYQYIKFDSNLQYNIGAPTFKLAVQWLPTRRMTVNFDVGRQLQRTVDGPTFGQLSDQVHGRIQYDIYHNIIGNLDATYQNNQFIGGARVDKEWTASAGVDYLLNENLALTLSYQHTQDDSNQSQYSFSDNRYMVSLKLSQ